MNTIRCKCHISTLRRNGNRIPVGNDRHCYSYLSKTYGVGGLYKKLRTPWLNSGGFKGKDYQKLAFDRGRCNIIASAHNGRWLDMCR